MIDINNMFDVATSESTEELLQSTRANNFLIVTDNVPPAFALLKCVTPYWDDWLRGAMVYRDDSAYLSSQEFLKSVKQTG